LNPPFLIFHLNCHLQLVGRMESVIVFGLNSEVRRR
jgi:hypothetical protein